SDFAAFHVKSDAYGDHDAQVPSHEGDGEPPAYTGFRPAPQRPSARGASWFGPFVFMPLVFYAVLATVAVIILWNRPDPREFLPDVEGDDPGPHKAKSVRMHYDARIADLPLPGRLRTGLGQKLSLGDLEVTPKRVERRKVKLWA